MRDLYKAYLRREKYRSSEAGKQHEKAYREKTKAHRQEYGRLYLANPENKRKRTEYQSEYRNKNRMEIRRKDREYYHQVYKITYKEHLRLSQIRYRQLNGDKVREKARRYGAKRTEKAIAVLGGKCAICGCDDKRVLQIDHINGGGHKELKKIHTSGIHSKILAGHTEGYQLLCANCNWIKRHTRGETRRRKLIVKCQ